MSQSGIGHGRPGEVEHPDPPEGLQAGQSAVGDLGTAQAEFRKSRKTLQVSQSGAGHARAGEVKDFEPLQTPQVA